MDKLRKLLREVVRQHKPDKENAQHGQRTIAIELAADGVEVIFTNGRRQFVSVTQQEEYCQMTSIILKRRLVEKVRRKVDLLPLIWQRNRETNLVSFDLDRRDYLIGRIEQPMETLEAGELFLYLEHLAWECDQMEYLLSGLEAA